jgi:hypothetical protein
MRLSSWLTITRFSDSQPSRLTHTAKRCESLGLCRAGGCFALKRVKRRRTTTTPATSMPSAPTTSRISRQSCLNVPQATIARRIDHREPPLPLAFLAKTRAGSLPGFIGGAMLQSGQPARPFAAPVFWSPSSPSCLKPRYPPSFTCRHGMRRLQWRAASQTVSPGGNKLCIAPKCGQLYHGNTHICNCGTENPYKVAKRAEQKADRAMDMAGQAIDIANEAKEEAGNHRKQIGVATAIVGVAGTFALGLYKATEHPYALYALLFVGFLMAICVVALFFSYRPRSD